MKTFKQRLQELYQNTDSKEVKTVCNMALESQTPANDSSVRSLLLEKFYALDRKPSKLRSFLSIEERIDHLNDIGLNEAINDLVENTDLVRKNPQLATIINKIKANLSNKVPAFMLAEKFLSAIQPFNYDPDVDRHYKNIQTFLAENEEVITLLKGKSLLENSRNKNMYIDVMNKIDNYVYESNISRNELIGIFEKYRFEPIMSDLKKVLIKYDNSGRLYLENTNNNFDVRPIQSFIYIIENDTHCFYHKGYFYTRKGNSLSILSENEVKQLPVDFVNMSRFLAQKNNMIHENVITFNIGNNKLQFVQNLEEGNKSFYNDKEVKFNSPKEFFSKASLQSNLNEKEVTTISKIWENLNTLINLDFGKEIKSKVYAGLSASIFRINENFYVHLNNPAMKLNEVKQGTGLQAKNEILEFLGYDISNTLYEFLSGDEAYVAKLKLTRNDIKTAISNLNEQLQKVEKAKELNLLPENTIKDSQIIDTINEQIDKLKIKYNEVNIQIGQHEKINEDDVKGVLGKDRIIKTSGDFDVNDQVRIKGTGEIAKIININTNTNTINLLLDDGDTKQVQQEEIEKIEDQLNARLQDIQNVAKKAADKLKSVQNTSEGSLHFTKYYKNDGGTTTVPYDTPHGKGSSTDTHDINTKMSQKLLGGQKTLGSYDIKNKIGDKNTVEAKVKRILKKKISNKIEEDMSSFKMTQTKDGNKITPLKKVITKNSTTSNDIVALAKKAAEGLKKK